MLSKQLFLRLSLGLASALAPLGAEAAPVYAPRPQCIRASNYQVPRAPVRRPAPSRVVCRPIPRAAVIPRTPAVVVPAPAALPADRPLSSGGTSGNSFRPAIPPSGPSNNMHWDAPDGSIAHSQQRQALAIGAVAVAVGAAIWMASREHNAQVRSQAGADGPAAAPQFDDPADAHAYAVQLALAKARKP